MKVPLEATYVRYEKDDLFGELLAYVTLTPIFLMVMYTTLVVFRRDFHIVFTLFGQLLSLILNKLLKTLIHQERPKDNDISDFGMPSNHSQFVSFFCIFYILHVFHMKPQPLSTLVKRFVVLSLLSLQFVVCYSRVYLSYHTSEQVIVGALVGGLFGALWMGLEIKYGQSLGDMFCSIPFIRFIGIRHFSPLVAYLSIHDSSPNYSTDVKKD
jgi:dolichyldiphosphatase